MTTVGSYRARRFLPQLLERVLRGEKILITKHGKPAALLVPATVHPGGDVKSVFARMKELRKGNKLGAGLTIRELIQEGRRF